MRYNFCGCLNMRDLGGYPTKSNMYTRNGVFIRSDLPKTLSDDERRFFMNKNIKTIIDFRKESAVQRTPNCFANLNDFDVINIPLSNGEKLLHTEEDYINQLLETTSNEKAFYEIFSVLADANGGVLFHCAEGKERTGVVSALLLDLAGVELNDIALDYSISGHYFREYASIVKANESAMAKSLGYENGKIPEFYVYTKPEYIEKFFALFKEKHGSVEEYVNNIGVSGEQIAKIKERVLIEL